MSYTYFLRDIKPGAVKSGVMLGGVFLMFLRGGLASRIREYIKRKGAWLRSRVRAGLSVLRKRYKVKLSVKEYLSQVCNALEVSVGNGYLRLFLPKEHKYYRVIKSMELGACQVSAVRIIGAVMAMGIRFIRGMYSDYEILKAKLDEMRENNDIRYRLYTSYEVTLSKLDALADDDFGHKLKPRWTPYALFERLRGRTKLL